jgi:hypothetical protein
MVLPPHEWFGLIQKVHSELGHFGDKHILSLLIFHYDWRGMYVQVRDTIARCDGMKISFFRQLTHFPLPI